MSHLDMFQAQLYDRRHLQLRRAAGKPQDRGPRPHQGWRGSGSPQGTSRDRQGDEVL